MTSHARPARAASRPAGLSIRYSIETAVLIGHLA